MNEYTHYEMWDEPRVSVPNMPPNHWEQAKTIRDRAFLRLLSTPGISLGVPSMPSLVGRMEIVRRNPEWRRRFRNLPLAHLANYRGRAKTGVEMTLHSALQDLGDILAMEADDAFHASYYPRLPHVTVPEERVEAIMTAMQRELDGEAHSRKKVAPQFSSLPWDRQCALAERRRYWFRMFGVGPRAWRRNAWSLWRIQDIPCPVEELKERKMGL